MLKRWRAVCNTVSDLTDLGFDFHTYHITFSSFDCDLVVVVRRCYPKLGRYTGGRGTPRNSTRKPNLVKKEQDKTSKINYQIKNWYPTPSEGWERTPNSRATPQGLNQRSKVEKVKWCAGETPMRDNPEGSELDPTVGVCKRCKENFPSVLSCMGKRTKDLNFEFCPFKLE